MQTLVESQVEEELCKLTRDVWQTKCEMDRIQVELRGYQFWAKKAQDLLQSGGGDMDALERTRRDSEIGCMKIEVQYEKVSKKYEKKRKALTRFFKGTRVPAALGPAVGALATARNKHLAWLQAKPF